ELQLAIAASENTDEDDDEDYEEEDGEEDQEWDGYEAEGYEGDRDENFAQEDGNHSSVPQNGGVGTYTKSNGDSSVATTRSKRKERHVLLENGDILDLVDENGQPFPGNYENALLDHFDEQPAPLRSAFWTRPGRHSRLSGSVEKQPSKHIIPKSQSPHEKRVH